MDTTGRVYLDNIPKTPFELFQAGHNEHQINFNDSLRSIQDDTPISQAYFSRRNIDNLHRQLINTVYKVSQGKYKIKRQSELQLQLIMRSIYLQNAKYLSCNIQQQVNELNSRVISYCVPKIISEIKQFLEYKKTVNTLPQPLEHSTNLSSKGHKTLTNNIGFGN